MRSTVSVARRGGQDAGGIRQGLFVNRGRRTPPPGGRQYRLSSRVLCVDQKSIVTLNLANRAEVIDNGFRYVAAGLRSVGEYAVW